MCLIAFGWQAHPHLDLIVAANRDEFHARETEPAHWWSRPPGVFGGRDLQAHGAWCAMDRAGRFAAVTNVREATPPDTPPLSRGLLVRDYFCQAQSAAAWAARTAAEGSAYGPFNLLIGDRRSLWFVSNRGSVRHMRLHPGVHAISNGHWGDHWPKTNRAEQRLAAALREDRLDDDTLFEILADTDPAPVDALPDTGVGLAREQFLSPPFIRSALYGTRASTVIRRGYDGLVDFRERSFDAQAQPAQRVEERWQLNPE